MVELRNQLDKFVNALRELRRERLSPDLISESDLDSALKQLQNKLATDISMYKVVHTDLGWYYNHARPTFIRVNNKLIISLFIPLSSNRERYYMYRIHTFEVPAPGQPDLYTYVNNDVEVFGINHRRTHFLEMSLSDWNSCKTYSSQHCRKAMKIYDTYYSTCLTALFNDEKTKIKALCDFKLEQKPLRPNLIPANDKLVVVSARTIIHQCVAENGMETAVTVGCDICMKPRRCNCIYVAQSPMGAVTLPPDIEHCDILTHHYDVTFPVNLAKMQHLWSDDYLKELSESVMEKVDAIPEAKFHIDDTKFEHALNRHYQFSMDLKKATEKAKQNIKIFPIKRLPASTWQTDSLSEFFTLSNTLTLIAMLIALVSIFISILTCRLTLKMYQKIMLIAVSASRTYSYELSGNYTEPPESIMDEYYHLSPTLQAVIGIMIVLTVFQLTLLTAAVSWYLLKRSRRQPHAILDVIIKTGRSTVRIANIKINCQPGTLRQRARRGVSDLRLSGSLFRSYLLMRWHGRTLSHAKAAALIYPRTCVPLTFWQGLKLTRLFRSSYEVSTELTYVDENGRKTVDRHNVFDRPISILVRYSSTWEAAALEMERQDNESGNTTDTSDLAIFS